MAEKKREWTVPADLPEMLRQRDFQPITEEETDRAYAELAAIQQRLRGIATVAAIGVEIQPARWVTIGFKFRWESFAPGLSFEDLTADPTEDETITEPDLAAVEA